MTNSEKLARVPSAQKHEATRTDSQLPSRPNLGGTIAGYKGNDSADRLLTPAEVAARLNVTKDWVWDHSSRKAPYLPVIRMGDGTLRYRASKIEEFIDERERLSALRHKSR